MPGPKGHPVFAFRDMYAAVIRLQRLSDTPKQHETLNQLILGLKRIEQLWGVSRLPDGSLNFNMQKARFHPPAMKIDG